MGPKLNRLVLVFIGILSIISLGTFSCESQKTHPEYHGVDSRAQPLVDEYMALAKIQGITFKNNVTIGFKTINDEHVVGLTTYGKNWREIDLDQDFWENSKKIIQLIVLFHELTHAYCTRGHDYKGKDYPGTAKLKKLNKKGGHKGPAYYLDGCPKSIMFPFILEEGCALNHYNDYMIEMFDNCESY